LRRVHEGSAHPERAGSLLALSYDPTLTKQIKVPVLFVQGRYDQLWCMRTGDCTTDPTSTSEHTYWDPNTSFTRVIIPLAAHSIHSSVTAPLFYGTTFLWLAQNGLDGEHDLRLRRAPGLSDEARSPAPRRSRLVGRRAGIRPSGLTSPRRTPVSRQSVPAAVTRRCRNPKGTAETRVDPVG